VPWSLEQYNWDPNTLQAAAAVAAAGAAGSAEVEPEPATAGEEGGGTSRGGPGERPTGSGGDGSSVGGSSRRAADAAAAAATAPGELPEWPAPPEAGAGAAKAGAACQVCHTDVSSEKDYYQVGRCGATAGELQPVLLPVAAARCPLPAARCPCRCRCRCKPQVGARPRRVPCTSAAPSLPPGYLCRQTAGPPPSPACCPPAVTAAARSATRSVGSIASCLA
jgi:hypothetical protein